MTRATERAFAVQIVTQACQLCRATQHALVSEDTLTKRDRSPVTVADFGVQALVAAALRAQFPEDPLVGEEDAAALRDNANADLAARVVQQVQAQAPHLTLPTILDAIDHGTHGGGPDGRFWTLDPIDGTKGFLRGEQYAVALALIEDGQVVLGVLGCPNLPPPRDEPGSASGFVLHAVQRHGAMTRSLSVEKDQPLRVTDVTDPAQAVFCESVESAHTAQDRSAAVTRKLGVRVPPHRLDSQAKYAAVARGDASVYLRLPTRADYEERIWDHAAGAIIVQEAGGVVTDVDGKPLDFALGRTLRDNRGVVATNGHLHEAVIDALAQG